jgi:hypothetical protein
LEQHTHDNGTWIDGIVTTPHGYVRVYSQTGARPYSSYRCTIAGREYFGSENRSRTKRGLTIMAVKFARQAAV